MRPLQILQPPLLRSGAVKARSGRRLGAAGSVALVAAIFGFALPHFASYRSVWASLYALTWTQALLVAAAAAASMASIGDDLLGTDIDTAARKAAVVNLGSNGVANTLPAGGALRPWGSAGRCSRAGVVSTAEYVLYTLVSGIWNVFALLGLPVLALLVLADGQPARGRRDCRGRRWPDVRRQGNRARPSHAQRDDRDPPRPGSASSLTTYKEVGYDGAAELERGLDILLTGLATTLPPPDRAQSSGQAV